MLTCPNIVVEKVRQYLVQLCDFQQESHPNGVITYTSQSTPCTFYTQMSEVSTISFSGYSGKELEFTDKLLSILYPEGQKYTDLVRESPGYFTLGSGDSERALVLSCPQLGFEVRTYKKGWYGSAYKPIEGKPVQAKDLLKQLAETTPLAAKLSNVLRGSYFVDFS